MRRVVDRREHQTVWMCDAAPKGFPKLPDKYGQGHFYGTFDGWKSIQNEKLENEETSGETDELLRNDASFGIETFDIIREAVLPNQGTLGKKVWYSGLFVPHSRPYPSINWTASSLR